MNAHQRLRLVHCFRLRKKHQRHTAEEIEQLSPLKLETKMAAAMPALPVCRRAQPGCLHAMKAGLAIVHRELEKL
jgi:hypothetical protein